MSNIKIHNISPSGSELFHDSESYLNELTDNEMGSIEGGTTISYTVTVTRTVSVTWTHTRTVPNPKTRWF
jgi:hypothetical protein